MEETSVLLNNIRDEFNPEPREISKGKKIKGKKAKKSTKKSKAKKTTKKDSKGKKTAKK